MKRFLIFSFIFCSSLYAVDATNLHRYMWANYHQFDGNRPAAHKRYQNILHNNGSLYSLQGYAHFLYREQRYKQVASLAPKIDKLFAKDPQLQMILAISLKKAGDDQAGNTRLIKLSQQFKDDPDIVMRAAEAYLQQKEPKNALSLIDDYLDRSPRRGNNFIFHYLKSQIFVQMNDGQRALTSVRKSIAMHPRFSQGWLLLAAIEEKAGKLDEAIKGYTTFLEVSDQTDKRIEKHLIELVMRQNMLANDKQVLRLDRSCMERAMILLNRKQYPEALKQINTCIESNPNDPKNKLLKIQIMTSMKQYQQAVDLVSAWIETNPSDSMWYRVLHIMPRAGAPMQIVLTGLERIHLKHPNSRMAVLYLADMHTRANNRPQALTYLHKAARMVTDSNIRTKILFQIAVINYEDHNFDLMKTNLEKAYALQSDFPPVLNLLAYYYATEEKNLEKAKTLIDAALEKDQYNPHFIDTKALVLYKNNHYEQALALLEPIAQKNPNDTTIRTHLAKTYRKLGKQQQADREFATIKELACSGHKQHEHTES